MPLVPAPGHLLVRPTALTGAGPATRLETLGAVARSSSLFKSGVIVSFNRVANARPGQTVYYESSVGRSIVQEGEALLLLRSGDIAAWEDDEVAGLEPEPEPEPEPGPPDRHYYVKVIRPLPGGGLWRGVVTAVGDHTSVAVGQQVNFDGGGLDQQVAGGRKPGSTVLVPGSAIRAVIAYNGEVLRTFDKAGWSTSIPQADALRPDHCLVAYARVHETVWAGWVQTGDWERDREVLFRLPAGGMPHHAYGVSDADIVIQQTVEVVREDGLWEAVVKMGPLTGCRVWFEEGDRSWAPGDIVEIPVSALRAVDGPDLGTVTLRRPWGHLVDRPLTRETDRAAAAEMHARAATREAALSAALASLAEAVGIPAAEVASPESLIGLAAEELRRLHSEYEAWHTGVAVPVRPDGRDVTLQGAIERIGMAHYGSPGWSSLDTMVKGVERKLLAYREDTSGSNLMADLSAAREALGRQDVALRKIAAALGGDTDWLDDLSGLADAVTRRLAALKSRVARHATLQGELAAACAASNALRGELVAARAMIEVQHERLRAYDSEPRTEKPDLFEPERRELVRAESYYDAVLDKRLRDLVKMVEPGHIRTPAVLADRLRDLAMAALAASRRTRDEDSNWHRAPAATEGLTPGDWHALAILHERKGRWVPLGEQTRGGEFAFVDGAGGGSPVARLTERGLAEWRAPSFGWTQPDEWPAGAHSAARITALGSMVAHRLDLRIVEPRLASEAELGKEAAASVVAGLDAPPDLPPDLPMVEAEKMADKRLWAGLRLLPATVLEFGNDEGITAEDRAETLRELAASALTLARRGSEPPPFERRPEKLVAAEVGIERLAAAMDAEPTAPAAMIVAGAIQRIRHAADYHDALTTIALHIWGNESFIVGELVKAVTHAVDLRTGYEETMKEWSGALNDIAAALYGRRGYGSAKGLAQDVAAKLTHLRVEPQETADEALAAEPGDPPEPPPGIAAQQAALDAAARLRAAPRGPEGSDAHTDVQRPGPLRPGPLRPGPLMSVEVQPKEGGHDYPGRPGHDPANPGWCFTSRCTYGCGCYTGPSTSGGPDGIDPWGACPKNAAASDGR